MSQTILLVGRTPSVIDHVIVGGGLDLERRLEIIREIFLSSNATTVHMNSSSGPESFLPFVQLVLRGIKSQVGQRFSAHRFYRQMVGKQ